MYNSINFKDNTITATDKILTYKKKQIHYIFYLNSSINYLQLVDIMLRRFS